MKNIEERLQDAIKERKFNFLEMTGFKAKPELALIAGAAIGYQMALDHVNELMDENKKKSE